MVARGTAKRSACVGPLGSRGAPSGHVNPAGHVAKGTFRTFSLDPSMFLPLVLTLRWMRPGQASCAGAGRPPAGCGVIGIVVQVWGWGDVVGFPCGGGVHRDTERPY